MGGTAHSDTVFLCLPHTHQHRCLKARVITAVKNIDASMLTRVWQELEYRIDVRRVTRGAHIERL
jgi:N-acetyl-gamma-glutamylphosphate reductase